MLTEGVKVSYQKDGSQRGDLIWLVDFACGSGSLILNVRKQMGEYGITVSICPSLSNFVRILASAPPRNKTPCGRMIAIVPSSSKK
jgi:hypothetical protein